MEPMTGAIVDASGRIRIAAGENPSNQVARNTADPHGPAMPGAPVELCGRCIFDECASGHLALPGGGCRLIGPRACSKLWDSEAESDCEEEDILPCPDGWVEGGEGLYCGPFYPECGYGERPLLGGGCERVVTLHDGCPAGPFPEAPVGSTDVVYAAAGSSCVGDCGSLVNLAGTNRSPH